MHLAGEGSLGFAKMIATDATTGITTTSNYSQSTTENTDGMFTGSTVTTSDGIVLEEKGLTWLTTSQTMADGTKRHLRRIPYLSTTKRDLNGASLGFTSESLTFDSYGFTLTHGITTSYNGSSVSKYTSNSYSHDATNWFMGRLLQSTVTHSETSKTSIVRTSSFTYDSTTGLLASETIEPNDALFHRKTYARNGFGAISAIGETWGSPETDGIEATERTTSFTYDAKARYRISETNPLGHTESKTYDAVTGLPSSSTGPNGITTTWAHDAFGRVTLETRTANRPEPSTTTTTREFCGGSVWCPNYGAIRITTSAPGLPTSITYQDKLYRTIAAATQSFDGRWVFTTTNYDSQGRVQSRSEPYFEGASTFYWTSVSYDTLGRPLITTRPNRSTQTLSYDGFTVTAMNELGQTKSVTHDLAGRMAQVTDNAGNLTTYSYDAAGQLMQITGPAGTAGSMSYDGRGNKVAHSDPDKGTWAYRYNALGMLVEQTDAKGQVTSMTYDVLGRMLTRTDDAMGLAASTSSWSYDTTAFGIGKLTSAESPGYASVHAYDEYGRASRLDETIDGNSVYSFATVYDSTSRPERTVFPSGLVVRNVYNAQGYLAAVTNEGASQDYWRALETDARGNVVRFTLGNGVETVKAYEAETGYLTHIVSSLGADVLQNLAYTYNPLGNLSQRQDGEQNLIERFAYDDLNRVVQIDTDYSAGSVANGSITLTYDAGGNITSKSDVGNYGYGAPSAACGISFAGPHAVTATSGTSTAEYCYDVKGNMVSGNGRTITWSSFDLPVEITDGLNTVSFAYGPDRAPLQAHRHQPRRYQHDALCGLRNI